MLAHMRFLPVFLLMAGVALVDEPGEYVIASIR